MFPIENSLTGAAGSGLITGSWRILANSIRKKRGHPAADRAPRENSCELRDRCCEQALASSNGTAAQPAIIVQRFNDVEVIGVRDYRKHSARGLKSMKRTCGYRQLMDRLGTRRKNGRKPWVTSEAIYAKINCGFLNLLKCAGIGAAG